MTLSILDKTRNRPWFIGLAFALLLSAAAPFAHAENSNKWKFVVFGDTRDNTPLTATGINKVLPRMVAAILAEEPEVVFHIGDLINGYSLSILSPMHGKYSEMFDNWQAAVKPVYDRKIPLYIIRGNHEYGPAGKPDKKLFNLYAERYAARMPQNGPPDGQGLTYRVEHRQGQFILLDQYGGNGNGKIRLDLPWLQKELKQPARPFTFVFGHAPAYRVTAFRPGHPYDLYKETALRDEFWQLLQSAGVTAFFCGHDHLYTRGRKDGVMQIVTGHGGAEFVEFDPAHVDSRLTDIYPDRPVTAETMKYGYMSVTIDEKAGTVTVVERHLNNDGVWDTGDRFVILRKQPGSFAQN